MNMLMSCEKPQQSRAAGNGDGKGWGNAGGGLGFLTIATATTKAADVDGNFPYNNDKKN